MTQVLRPYQTECVQAVMDSYEQGYRRVLYTLPTGTGKTTTFSELIKQFLANDWKVLVLAHRVELIQQAFNRIKEHNDLDYYEIGAEIADVYAPRSASVVVGSVMTVKGAHRLDWFKPDAIIVDECHRAGGASFKMIAERAGVNTGDCFYVGCTATARRTDRQSLFAFRPNGERVTLTDKKNRKFEADPADCVFEKHVYEYPLTDALEDGWLVPIVGHIVQTDTDLSGVSTSHGDFSEGHLEKAVTNAARTNLAINAWKQVAEQRQTLVFCAGVEHAHHAAQMWQQAGYTAAAIDGTTEKDVRRNHLSDFKSGKLQVLCNCGVFTEGTDLPTCSAVVHLRPTKSWNLYVQMCVDMQTEILTEQGWRTPDTIQRDDRAAGFDMATGSIRWNAIKDIINRPLSDADEAMYSFNSPSVDFRVTGGHQMIYRTRADRQKGLWRKTKAEDLSDRSDQYEIPVSGVQASAGATLSDDELRFIGWFLTDGTLNKHTDQIVISQAEHQPYHKDIRDCLEGCGFKYGVYVSSGYTQFNRTSASVRYAVSKGKSRGRDSHLNGWAELEPYIDKDFSPNLEECTPAQLAILLEAMNMGDGCKYHGKDWTQKTYRICTGRKAVADRLQSLCVRRGFRCNQSTHYFNQNPIHYLHIRPETARTVGGSKAKDRASLVPCVYDLSEHVWCLETEMGAIITRRNGKVTIMGNTGRGTRTLPGVVNDEMTAEERRQCIATSFKPDCVVIDLVDITKDQDLCSAPSILDLPANMDLQGQSVLATKKMLDEFEEVRDQVIGECPRTYQELAVRLSQVALLRDSGARTKEDWATSPEGWRFRRARPGYQCNLTMPEPGMWNMEVKKGQEVILTRKGKPGHDFRAYVDSAARHASEAIERHAEANMPSRGTLTRLSPKQVNVLKVNGHKINEIDAMPYAKAKATIDKYMQAWQAKKDSQD